ncbi:putative FBD-associated F-box protein At1g05080 [Eutrema salsugineum]|uniref:putative FBD-associated F-box protein At1g05080 n=1 Tax=Eutrema salsugineum TaxID=72664 RepID=UPI000CED0A72|nr:putative FBD-associated F-box protein At1g05080 [Eutrema salsugineum]
MMPKIEYKESKSICRLRWPRRKSVYWFLYESLKLHKAPVIDSLCVKLGPLCPATDVDVEKLVAKVFDRVVRELEFKLLWSGNLISLPNSLYTCDTLISLKLCHKIFIDFPSLGCLPSLKTLCLSSVVYKDEVSLVRCLVIDTPALKHLSISYLSVDHCSIENMPCLDSAAISFSINCYDHDKFLRCLSSVLTLELCFDDITLQCCSTINFSRLVKLHICPDESDWLEPLILLLGNSPNLKYLLVDYVYIDQPKDLSLSWNQPTSVPGCLSCHLKIFEWMEGYEGRVEEKEFVTYILANSKCLERAKITLRYNLEDKQNIMEELKSIPRVSKASQLLFK